jgi:hypothetical protein
VADSRHAKGQEMIRYQFVASAALTSRLIAWWGSGYASHGYSHVDCLMVNGDLIGARWDDVGGGSGVRVRSQFYEKWIRRTVVEIPCTLAQSIEWDAWVRRQCGKPYDPGAILGFLTGDDRHSPGRWICSAMACASGEYVKIIQSPPVKTSEISPNDYFLMSASVLGARATTLEPQPEASALMAGPTS